MNTLKMVIVAGLLVGSLVISFADSFVREDAREEYQPVAEQLREIVRRETAESLLRHRIVAVYMDGDYRLMLSALEGAPEKTPEPPVFLLFFMLSTVMGTANKETEKLC